MSIFTDAIEQAVAAHRARQVQGGVTRANLAPDPSQALPMLPGATPMPPGVGGAPAAPPPGPPGLAPGATMTPQQALSVLGNPSATQMPSGAPPAPPAGPVAPPAGAAPQPAPAAGGDGLSGTAAPTGLGGPADATKTVKAIFERVAKANPGAKPDMVFQIAQQQIALMKGVEPEAKDYMNFQIRSAQIDAKYAELGQKEADFNKAMELKQQQLQEKSDALDKALAAAKERNDAQIAGREHVAQIGASSRESVAGTNAASRETVQKERNAGGLAVQGARNAGGLAVQKERNKGGLDRQTAANQGGVDRAVAGFTGKKPLSAETVSQYTRVPPASKAAAKSYLKAQGYDVSALK